MLNQQQTPLVDISNLTLSIGQFEILHDISLHIHAGEVLGLVGESGSGKSMTAMATMQLLPSGAKTTGKIMFEGQNLLEATESQMCGLRGDKIGMVFQEPMTALNPVHTIGDQVAELVRLHAPEKDAKQVAHDALCRVGLPPEKVPHDRYPHDLSGGQRQRVVIAMATALRPKLLIADEPTTALDVTTQAVILELLRELAQEDGAGLLIITHDLAVVADMADRVAIMQHGRMLETGETVQLFENLSHPYSKALFEASTHAPARRTRPVGDTLLSVENVCRTHKLPKKSLFEKRRYFEAVKNVSLSLHTGENVGLVGESGCGKSTLARAVLALEPVQSGRIELMGHHFDAGHAPDELRRDAQVVFQDPYGSFNPRWKVADLVAEPFHLLHPAPPKAEQRQRVEKMLEAVGLKASDADKFPHEFSGGQRQRIAIARALVTEPKFVVLDEAVSALDVSVRAQVLDLLADLGERLDVSYLFISHDLHVVRAITDRVLVMKGGEILEEGTSEEVFANPQADYTRKLLSATPDMARALARRKAEQEAAAV